ncbi:MAG: hypothetical protein E7L01_31765 [Paenibacillus macerans]|uniref:hypothetical protein n=1 Tax=Paenibacillus macerans TaxID=44252 RepID=UPI0029130C7D|nr:hypothetical protein [Paenibacillus macerans]MDU7477885.1 hypothetical protein [Paenibacillus macerans]
MNKNTKIKEIYNKDENFCSDTVLFIKEDSAKGIGLDESMQKIAEKMVQKKLVGNIEFYVVADDKFEAIRKIMVHKYH